jgi:hypothetical protein
VCCLGIPDVGVGDTLKKSRPTKSYGGMSQPELS